MSQDKLARFLSVHGIGHGSDYRFSDAGHANRNSAVMKILRRCCVLSKDMELPRVFLMCISGARFLPGLYLHQLAEFVKKAALEIPLDVVVTPLYVSSTSCVCVVRILHYGPSNLPLTRVLEDAWTTFAGEKLTDPFHEHEISLLFVCPYEDGREHLIKLVNSMKDESFQNASIIVIRKSFELGGGGEDLKEVEFYMWIAPYSCKSTCYHTLKEVDLFMLLDIEESD